MRIPKKNTGKFVREIVQQCMSSRSSRTNRGHVFDSYYSHGSSDPANPAMYNKIFSSLDDLESLLYSPVSMRFHIGDPDLPNVVNEAKGRAVSARLRQRFRQSNTDSLISQALNCGLVKGMGIVKLTWGDDGFRPVLVQPEDFGVLRENHNRLDPDMEGFNHSMLITPHQFRRLVAERPDAEELQKKAKRYMRDTRGERMDARGSMPITSGTMFPLQMSGQGLNQARGVVDWMATPTPDVSPEVEATMLEMDETWIWDDQRNDWATFQTIGDDMLIMGRYQIVSALSYDPESRINAPMLTGVHPYSTICPNPVPGYFWGLSEIARLMLLQEGINSRITGINSMLRKQEKPSTKFVGGSGVNQLALSRFNKPDGYYVDAAPTAKIEREAMTIPQDVWASLHEYERMFDEMMGLPPVAKGHGEKGVRSANHAEALVRMFSPRFKDRALLVERDVEALGALGLDLTRANDSKKLVAWVAEGAAGLEADPDLGKVLVPPAKGLVPVLFTAADLPDDVTLTIDAHSSSPAFAQDAKALIFDGLKTGMLSPTDAIERLDFGSDTDELIMGVTRREIAKAEAAKEAEQVKLASHGGKK